MAKNRNSFKYTVLKFLAWFGISTGIGVMMKVLFIALNVDIYSKYTLHDYLNILWHGLPMDLCVAGYLTIFPALLLIIKQFASWSGFRWIERGYSMLLGAILGWVFVADDMLYGYWEFKLDTTPIFYFTTSPSAAMASITWWQYLAGALLWIAFGAAIYFALWYGAGRLKTPLAMNVVSRWRRTGWLLLLTSAMFLPIRGGVTVSTMNLSKSYFSNDQRLNHAAVNPVFSLLYSATHRGGDLENFTYYDTGQAIEIFNQMMTDVPASTGSDAPLLRTKRPDVYIIILESFSAHLLPSMGGEPIAVKLDSIAQHGVLFANHYASGYRTDRAIPAILSGYPAVPTVSVMKEVARSEKLPSIARTLGAGGYTSTYYYGGDANFTNMKAYLLSAGFDRMVSDVDFAVSDRMSKWGVLDHVLLERAIDEVKDGESPSLTVIQTSSSHEPYEVPYDNPKLNYDKAVNAFGYTDEAVARFVNELRDSPRWDNALVILVPDHYSYPKNEQDFLKRHHVPLVMTGGALSRTHRRIDTPMSQSDIAATLLGAMDVDHSDFRFSRDVMQYPNAGGAFFASIGNAGWVTPNDTLIYEYTGDRVLNADAADVARTLSQLKAFLQILYTDFEQPQQLTDVDN